MEYKKKGLMDRLSDFIIDNIAPPLAKFANLRPMQVIRGGLVATMPVILASSVFLILYILASPSVGDSGVPLLPFLAPFAGKFILVNNYCLNFLAIYAVVALSQEFADVYDVPKTACTMLGLATFFALTIGRVGAVTQVVQGIETTYTGVSIANFGGQGLFAGFIAVFWAGLVLEKCIKHNIVIKLPNTVPPAIATSFSAVIPAFFAIGGAWIVRSLLDIDIATVINTLLAPIFKAADSAPGYSLTKGLISLLWSVGIHGDNMINAITSPFLTVWLAENVAAMETGTALTQLPHIWTTNFDRLLYWTSGAWGLLFWMFFSKVEAHRALAKTALPSAIFTIVEPLVFGMPIVMNPLLMVPFLISTILSTFVGYTIMSMGFINRYFINLPWATPPFIIAGVSNGGDWKGLILVAVSFLIGVIVYWPFMKALEKQELEIEAQRAKELAAEA